jgi:hypothetical protein
MPRMAQPNVKAIKEPECIGELNRAPLEFARHWENGGSGHALATHWLRQSTDGADTFQSFISLWIAVNGWAQRITREELDSEWVKTVGVDPVLRSGFADSLANNHEVRAAAESLIAFAPIFRATEQMLFPSPPYSPRRERVAYWLGQKISEKKGHRQIVHRPRCYEMHLHRDGSLPCDWPHVLHAIYQIRCNLFHGSKSAAVDEDRKLVSWSRAALLGFLTEGRYLTATHWLPAWQSSHVSAAPTQAN